MEFIDLGHSSIIKNINLEAGGGYQFFQTRFFSDSSLIHTLTKYDNTFAEGRITLYSKNERLKLSGGGQYVVKGDNAKSISFDASARIHLGDVALVEAVAEQCNH